MIIFFSQALEIYQLTLTVMYSPQSGTDPYVIVQQKTPHCTKPCSQMSNRKNLFSTFFVFLFCSAGLPSTPKHTCNPISIPAWK